MSDLLTLYRIWSSESGVGTKLKATASTLAPQSHPMFDSFAGSLPIIGDSYRAARLAQSAVGWLGGGESGAQNYRPLSTPGPAVPAETPSYFTPMQPSMEGSQARAVQAQSRGVDNLTFQISGGDPVQVRRIIGQELQSRGVVTSADLEAAAASASYSPP